MRVRPYTQALLAMALTVAVTSRAQAAAAPAKKAKGAPAEKGAKKGAAKNAKAAPKNAAATPAAPAAPPPAAAPAAPFPPGAKAPMRLRDLLNDPSAILELKTDLIRKSYNVGQAQAEKSEVSFLSLAPADLNATVEELPETWLSSKRYRYSVMVLPAKDINVYRDTKDVQAGKLLGAGNPFAVDLIIQDRSQCTSLVALDKQFRTQEFDICAGATDRILADLGIDKEAFSTRRQHGFWAQAGTSFLTQIVSRASTGQDAGPTRQAAIRVGGGGWYKNYGFEMFLRQQVINFAATSFAPRWIHATASYTFELPRFWSTFTPFISLFAGFEIYNNTVSARNTRYIGAYRAPQVGFRSRFVIGSKIETGGDLLFSATSGLSKFFIQGDIRYWLTQRLALGAGYWVDTAKQSQINFRETSLALESYLRYTF